jgi:hypothetical protein
MNTNNNSDSISVVRKARAEKEIQTHDLSEVVSGIRNGENSGLLTAIQMRIEAERNGFPKHQLVERLLNFPSAEEGDEKLRAFSKSIKNPSIDMPEFWFFSPVYKVEVGGVSNSFFDLAELILWDFLGRSGKQEAGPVSIFNSDNGVEVACVIEELGFDCCLVDSVDDLEFVYTDHVISVYSPDIWIETKQICERKWSVAGLLVGIDRGYFGGRKSQRVVNSMVYAPDQFIACVQFSKLFGLKNDSKRTIWERDVAFTSAWELP